LLAALAAPPFAATAAYGNFAFPLVFLVRLWRTSLAILKFYLLSRFAGLPKSEKEFLLLQNFDYLLYIEIVLNIEVVLFISRLGQFRAT
jgi:hypothetical protein